MNSQGKRLKPLLVYLGRRGGGLQLLLDTTYSLTQKGIPHNLIVSGIQAQRLREMGIYIDSAIFVELPHTFYEAIMPKYFYKNVKQILKLCNFSFRIRSSLIVQIMPSPFDVLIDLLAFHNSNMKVRCVHDLEPHLGERWPKEKAINFRIKLADVLVFFSSYVSDKVKFNSEFKRIVSLPYRFYGFGTISSEISEIISKSQKSSKLTYLCIGRIHEYKGVQLISTVSDFAMRTNFILAGSGTTTHTIPHEVIRISKWLTDSEFQALIRVADVLVFPYLESTQSGTIPIAINEGKTILVADVGGLPEQILGYSKGFIFEHANSNSFLLELEKIQSQLETGDMDSSDTPREGIISNATLPVIIEELVSFESRI